jgi:type VI secretion system Hcp family effector
MQSMFLKIDGIDGECTMENYEDQIEVYSFSTGFSQPTSALRSSEGGGTVARPHCSDVSFSKRYDKSSPALCQALWEGKTIKSAVLTLCRSDKDALLAYLTVTLSNVVISSYNMSGGGDLPGETFSLNYSKVEVTYLKQKQGGGNEGKASASYDLSNGKLESE